MEDNGLTVNLKLDARNRLTEPWNDTLVVKLIGAAYSYNYMESKLAQKWRSTEHWQLIDLHNNFFALISRIQKIEPSPSLEVRG